MAGTTNSISLQLEQALQLQSNAMKIANGFRDAVLSQNTSVLVELENVDGSTFSVNIPTNVFLGNKLDSLAKTIDNLIGLSKDSKTRLIATSDINSISEIMINSKNEVNSIALTKDDFSTTNEIKIRPNAAVESLMSPLPVLEISLDNVLDTSTYIVDKYVFESPIEVESGITHKALLKYLTINKIPYQLLKSTIQLSPKKRRYTGNFTVLSSKIVGMNIEVEFDKLTYNDSLNIVDNSKKLSVGDILAKSSQSIVYEVESIKNDRVLLKPISGVGSAEELSVLSFIDKTTENKIVLEVPVKLYEHSAIFLTPINTITNVAGIISEAFIFNSSDYHVTENNNDIPFDEYFNLKISDISSYFLSILTENIIPVNLAVQPAVPELSPNNFKILQVNTHLTNSTVTDKLEKLQKEKSITENQLSVIQNTIGTLNTKINSGNYANNSKRDADKSLLNSKIQERDEKSTLLSSIVQNISSTVSNTSKDSFKPKFKLRGFWKVGDDAISAKTRNQKIVQYDIRYRYTKLKTNTSVVEQFTYTDGETDISATFSPWNYTKTTALNRVVTDNSVEWSINDEASIDEININQVDIPISYGEAVEFQVRAISEAGWPTSPIKSEWSKLIRKEFGDDVVKENTILSILEKNSNDMLKVQVENEFRNQGFNKHLSTSYVEQEKYFGHKLEDIASGKMTDEQKTISALEYVMSIEKKVSELQEIVNRRYQTIAIQLVDDVTLQTYDVNNFSTIKLFGGNYVEQVDLSVEANYGSIVTKKFYLKLTNQNVQTVEVLSIAPGGLTQNIMSAMYADVPVKVNTEGFVNQKKGQIFYNRLQNIDQTDLLYADDNQSTLEIPSSDIDTSATLATKNVVHQTLSNSIELVKLSPNASMDSYVAMTIDHPSYIDYKSTGQIQHINEAFERIKNFNSIFRSVNVQQIKSDKNIYAYEENDKFLVGQNSVGAALYTSLNDFTSFQVQGVDASASKEIYSGAQDSILIPIIFQYRMTDALGNVNGLQSLNANSNFEYSKRLGFDLLINNKMFSFDVEIYAKYRPTSTANQRLDIVPSTNNIRTKIN